MTKETIENEQIVSKTASLIILWGLLVIVFFRPLISGITWPWSNTYSQILILFILAIWLLGMAVKGEFTFRRTLLDVPIFLFSLSLIISLVNSVNKEVSFNQAYQFLSYPLLYFIIVNNLEAKLTPRQRTALIFALGLTIALLVAVWLRGLGLPLFSAVAPLLTIMVISIPLLRNLKGASGKSRTVHGILLPLILIAAVLVSIYGIYQYYWGLEQTRRMIQTHNMGRFPPNFMSRLGVNKIFSTFVFPPALAGYLILLLPLTISLFIYARSRWQKLWLGLTLALEGLGLYFTYSKGGWVSFLLSLTFLTFILGRKQHRLFLISFLILIGLFLIIVLSGILPYIKLEGFMASFQVRIDYWKGGLRMLKDYPLFGSGLGTFGSLYAKYKLAGAEETQLAHNNYLQIWIETGILGIISFLWLWGAFLKAGWRNIKKQLTSAPVLQRSGQEKTIGILIGCYIGVIAFLIHSLADFDLYIQGITTYVWLFMGIVIVASNRKLPVISYKLTNPFSRIVAILIIVPIIIFLMITVRKPMVAERYFQRSSVYLNQGPLEKGIAYINKAIRLNPRKSAYRYQLGVIYQNKGLLDKAITQYREAIEHNPSMPYYHSTLGKALWDKAGGKDRELIEEAIREFEKARDSYPTKPDYHLLLGRIYELSGRRKEAIRQYEEALELDSSLDQVKTRLEKLQSSDDS